MDEREVKILILRECRASRGGLSFSNLKSQLIDRDKAINSKTTLSKYLKELVKERMLERDVDTRAYKIAERGIAYLNETEILTRQISEKEGKPYIYDEAQHLNQVAMIGEEKGEKSFVKNFVANFLRRQRREAISLRILTDAVSYWKDFIPFESQIYLNKEFSKFFTDFFNELKNEDAFFRLEYFFMDVADALHKIYVKNSLISRRTKKNGYYTAYLKENVEKAELVKRAGIILVAWPRTPEWVQSLMREENLNKALEEAERLDQLYEKRKALVGERLKNDSYFRRAVIRLSILEPLLFGIESHIERALGQLECQGQMPCNLLERVKNEIFEDLRTRLKAGEHTLPSYLNLKFEPNPNEVNEAIEWVKGQEWVDIIIKYTWTKNCISKIWRETSNEIDQVIKGEVSC